jgi:hypothetical protein
MSTRYKTFTRSAKNWEQFASARKITVRRNLTIDEARRMCASYNDNRTTAQQNRGTKMEFTAQ